VLCATALVACAQATAVTLSSTPEGDAVVAFRFPETSRAAPFFAALRPAGGVFGTATRLTPRDASDADVASGPGASGVAAWTEKSGAVRAAFREAGQGWGRPSLLAKDGGFAHAAIDANGAALVVWTRADGRMRSATRPPAGPFDEPRDLPSSGQVQALAMDAAGDALVLSIRDETHIEASYRPAGGPFGAARFAANAGSYDPPKLAMNAAGDAIAGYTDPDGAVSVSRRPAGGEFAPHVVVSSPKRSRFLMPSTTVDDVALAGDGSAVVTWTNRTDDEDDYVFTIESFAALAAGGGKFERPLKLSALEPGFDARAAAAESGDMVVAWGQPRFGVNAMFRPGGGAFGAPIRLAGPRLGGTPDVSLDRAGQATAAWQQNDGERVQFATRSFAAAGPIAPAQVLHSVPAYRRFPNARARCHPPGTRTLLETRDARVYADLRKNYSTGRTSHYHPKYGCFFRRGKPEALEYGFGDFALTAKDPPAMALAGPLVAYLYFDEQCGTCGGGMGLTVKDLRTGDTANGFSPDGNDPDPDTFDYGRIRKMVLRRDAALGYIMCGACRAARVFKIDSGAPRPVLLAKGTGVDPHFLRLRHGRLQWRAGDHIRSAPLR
jgi:hypothetical protein